MMSTMVDGIMVSTRARCKIQILDKDSKCDFRLVWLANTAAHTYKRNKIGTQIDILLRVYDTFCPS
jgi:hypothetical protein